MQNLRIMLLGQPRIERGNSPLEVDTRKAIALLARLAAGDGGGESRDSLAALFWPDAPADKAHAALRRTLSVLNKGLAGEWLVVDRESVSLARHAGLTVDVERFETCLEACRQHGHPANGVCERCLPLLAEAAGLYRGDFMAGFTLRDSPGFDDWQFFQAEGFRRLLAGALDRLAAGHAARGEFETAIGYARRWLSLDPLHEPAHQRLMQLYDWSDQRSAALRQYRDCVRVLEQELDVAPLEETTELYAAIRERRAPPPPHNGTTAAVSAATEAPPAAGPHLPLVGRAAEWRSVLSAYQAVGPAGRLILLEGEAGIGKTRLAEALLHHAASQGARAVVARCYEGELNLAYGPIVAALRAALAASGQSQLATLDRHWLAEASRLLPELRQQEPDLPSPAALDSPGAQTRFFDGVSQALLTLLHSPGHAGVLVLDDAHWIDTASLDLLTYMVRRLRERPVCLLLTWRAEDVPAGHRLRQLLAEAHRAGTGLSLTLARLNREAVAELARSMWPATLPAGQASLVERLFQETEGLPFFVVEYLAALSQPNEQAEHLAWPLPGGVRSLLEARLGSAGETGSQLLHTAAVIGRSFDFDTLHSASGRGDEETIGGLEALMAAGLVQEVSGLASDSAPAYDFTHEKLRRLVYEQTSLARRRLLHRRVAEALSARGRRTGGAMASQVAQHYQLAGREAEAAEYFKQAGEHARGLYANAEALAHYQSALALGHPASAALHSAIGDLQTLRGDYDAALASYETGAAVSSPAELPDLEHKLGTLYHRLGNWEMADSHFQSALSTQGGNLPVDARARINADWSLTALQAGQPERALALAQEALQLAQACKDQRALAQAHNMLGILASKRGNLEVARSHLENSLALAEALGDSEARVAALNNLALAHANSDQHAQAIALTQQALKLCAAQGDRHREAALHSNLADLLHATGQADDAMAHLKRSAVIYAEIGTQAGAMQPGVWKLAEW